MATVKLFGNFRKYAAASTDSVQGETVEDVLRSLCNGNSELSAAIFDGESLRPYVRVMIAGHDIELSQGLKTPVSESDSIAIFPPIAGGC